MADTLRFNRIWEEAEAAGKKALAECTPTPMTVQEVGLDNRPYPGSQSYYVEDGVCGFAWVTVRPGNSPFANWLKANDYGRKDEYYGGVTIWIKEGNQSMQKKEAYGEALAEVFRQHDIRAYCASRLD